MVQARTLARIIPSMPPELGRITVFCFAASYAVALVLELGRQLRPRPALVPAVSVTDSEPVTESAVPTVLV